MNKRLLQKAGMEVSTLGFGAMRLPLKDNKDNGSIDKVEATKMIRYAIDNGVNYIDTAVPYHDQKGELFVGEVLKDGYREKVYLTTKLPCWNITQTSQFNEIFKEQLKRLQVQYLDIYLLHSMQKKSWENVKKLGVLSFLDDIKKQKKIKAAGFSFHDTYEVFKEIIDGYDWDVCQIQFNYFDVEAKKMLDYATLKGVDVIVMEPLRGGRLVNKLPNEIKEIFNTAKIKRSPVEWAFRWLYNYSSVKLILSGMSDMEQVKDNIRIFNKAKDNSMDQEEMQIMGKVSKVFKDKIIVPCTSCQYCMPCPHGVAIPLMFENYNTYSMFDNSEEYIKRYKNWKAKEQNKFTADICVGCKICEEKCPQSINISMRMKEIEKIMG